MAYTPPLPGAGAGATGGTWRLTAEDLGVNYVAYFAKKPTASE